MISVSNLPVDKTNFSDLPALSDAASACKRHKVASQSLRKTIFQNAMSMQKTHVQSEALNPVRATTPYREIATVDHQDHALGHRSCVSVSEARAYRKRRQGCISIVPVHSMKGALCNEKVFFMFRIDKSL